MFEGRDQVLFELLARKGTLDQCRLDDAWAAHLRSERSLADTLIEDGWVGSDDLFQTVASHLATEFVAEPPVRLADELVSLLDRGLARSYRVVPLRVDSHVLSLLAEDPLDERIERDLAFVLDRNVRVVVADPRQVSALVHRHFSEEQLGVETAIGRLQLGADLGERNSAASEADLENMTGRTPIVQFVNSVLSQAIKDKASDIHFEPFEHEFRVRYRVDGALREIAPPPRALAVAVVSRVKVLANLNIAERRVPQDGRIKQTFDGRFVDLRVSTLPTQFGESVVLRVLDRSAEHLELSQLTLPAEIELCMRAAIKRPNGILVVTGPTGSGKTTTIYGCLRELNLPDVKILTIEDPIEYEVDGVMQVAVNEVAGLGFARALRAFLRQDPDIVMVGEIRDAESAQIAIQAALTGHLVLTTLHTNDAAGAVTRLIDLGVEPFLLAATLEGVLAQRLVRRICPDCRTAYTPTAEELRECGVRLEAVGERRLFTGRGCLACGFSGFRGRRGIFEYLQMDESLRELVVAGASLAQLRQRAMERGMRSLHSAGLEALLQGDTTLGEVQAYL